MVRVEPDSQPDVIEAPLEEVQHIPEPVQLVEEGLRPKISQAEQQVQPGDVWPLLCREEVQEVHQESWDLIKKLNKFNLGGGGHN